MTQPLIHLLHPEAFAHAAGFTPDPWQLTVLDPTIRLGLLCCARQSGKTTAVAHRAAYELATRPGSTVLIVSATENHASEIALRLRAILHTLGIAHHKQPGTGRPHDYVVPQTRSRFLALPCTESAARNFTATLIILDEAALVPDKVWFSLAGTQAATWHRATLWLLSTPRGRHGFFHQLYTSPDPAWTRLKVPATACPRITPAFLEQKRHELPPWVFAQDYLCQFGGHALSVFPDDDIQAALHPPAHLPRHVGALPAPAFYLGVDLGQSVNHSALVTLEAQSIPTTDLDPVTYQQKIDLRLRLRGLQRLPLQLPYTEVIRHIRAVISQPEFVNQITIVLDATGGNVFLDHLRAARLGAPIIPALLTAGHHATESQGKHHIPKHDLITNLEALFRERKLWLEPQLPHLAELIHELHAFERIPGPQGKETYSGKAQAQDDLVIALALAAWRAVKARPDLRHHRGIWGTQRLL